MGADHYWTTPSVCTKGDFDTRFWNPHVKLAIQCTLIHSPINCICDIDFLWSNISCDNILQFVTDVVQKMGVFGKLIQYTMPILYSIPSPCITPPCVLSHCPHYYPVAFQGRCAQVFQIYSNRKLTDPHIQQKMWPISIHPCQYI